MKTSESPLALERPAAAAGSEPPAPLSVAPLPALRPHRRRRRLVWIALAILAAAGAAWGAVHYVETQRQDARAAEELTTFPVLRGDLHVTVAEAATLKAKRAQRIWPDIDGRSKIAWLIEEGTVVDSGDTLVLLETEDLKQNIDNTEIQFQAAASARVQAAELLDIQKRQNESDLQAARVRLEIANLELARYREGEIPRLTREAKLKLDKAQVDLQLAKEDLVGMDEYVEKGYFTKKDFETRKLAERQAADALETATKDLQLLEKYTIPRDLAQKQSDVDQAKTGFDLATMKAASELAKKTADLNERSFTEQRRLASLNDLKARLSKMTLRAPGRGMVVYGDDRQWWMRGDIQVGMDVWRGRVLMTLPDLDEIEALVSINEVDLDKVQIGQNAAITLDAYGALRFRGRVTRIASLADRQGGRFGSDVRTFEVTVEFDMADARQVLAGVDKAPNNGNKLRPGMSAKVEIDVTTLTNVLYVPVDAVYEVGGAHGCYVLRGGEPVWQPVEIGPSNRTHVEIKRGLSEGERVARYDPKRGAGQTTTRPSAGLHPTSRPATQPAARPADASRGRRGARL
jgi:HlyD family secretion protein